MADLRRMHITISKGMKLTCTVEHAQEDVIIVSLKHKAKEYRGALLDASERHFPPGLCYVQDNAPPKTEGENAGNSSADGPEQPQTKDVKGDTLDRRYSYNHDPAKYNEQPLPIASPFSIRPPRGKQVRNIRLRPRQTLCSKCKAAIHDSKSKSPSKNVKVEGEGADLEAHPHNTRYRAALSGKPSDGTNAQPGPTLRSGVRNKRTDSTPKVLLENIRPKREVKPTAKKKDADAQIQKKLAENSSRRNTPSEEQSSDSSASKSDYNKGVEAMTFGRRDDESSRVMMERSVSLDNPTALSQYNKQPVVRLDKTAVNNMSIRTEVKEESKQEKAPTISIVNIRSTPAIKISYGGAGDRDVVKIPPRLPGTEFKSPDGHSTADESPAPVSPCPPPSPPQKKAKKASKRTRDKQRYRIVNEGELTSEVNAQGIKIAGHHRKHRRKHKHRHASSEDENFNSEIGVPTPAKHPAIITKLSVVPPVNDMNGNEKKSDSEVLKDSSNETPTQQDELGEGMSKSPNDVNETASQARARREEGGSDFTFDSDPLSLRMEPLDPAAQQTPSEPRSPSCVSSKEPYFQDQFKTEERLPPRSDAKPFEMWASPVKIEAPTFDMDGSPTGIEAPPFLSDDSHDELIIGPLRLGNSPMKEENITSCDSTAASVTPPPSRRGFQGSKQQEIKDDEGEENESVPYGVGVFEDLTPDEDEDDHDDSNVSQPLYQLPVTKKSRMIYGAWGGDTSHVSGYLSKKPAAALSESYPNRSRMYQNGPSSYFSPNPGSSSIYPSNPSAVFASSQQIQNSPTPMIQKSPVPIFNYHGSRYQGSPNRRFGSSPSRRFHSHGESATSRTHSIIEGSIRHSHQSSHSRYQGQEGDQFPAPRDAHSSSSRGYRNQGDPEPSHPNSGNRYPSKFESRSTIRYQGSNDKNLASGFASPAEISPVSRLPSAEDNGSSGSKSYRAGEGSSTLRFVSSSGDSGSAQRFAIPSDGSSSAPQYTGQGSSGSLSRYSSHPSEGSLSNQYPSLGSTDSRYPPHSDSRYKLPNNASIVSSPSPLSLQTSSRSTPSLVAGSSFHADKERRNSVPTAPRYETVDPSALFMTHGLGHNPANVGDSGTVQNFLGKSLTKPSLPSQIPATRVPNSETAKSSNLFSAPQGQSAPFLRQDPSKLVSGSSGGGGGSGSGAGGSGGAGQSVLFHGTGLSNNSGGMPHHTSSSSTSSGLTQGHHPVTVDLSDSDEDDSDNAVPGVMPTPGMLSTGSQPEDLARMPMMKIHSQNLSSCVTDGRSIHVGDVQWGKVQGFPWWPCRVISIKMTHRDHREQDVIITQVCHVSWFGSSTVSDLPPSELRPFRDEFARRHVKKKRGPYQHAVQQAMIATDLTALVLNEGTRAAHAQQQPLSFGLMHDLVS